MYSSGNKTIKSFYIVMSTLFLATEKRCFLIIIFELETFSQHTSFKQQQQKIPGLTLWILFLLLEKKFW